LWFGVHYLLSFIVRFVVASRQSQDTQRRIQSARLNKEKGAPGIEKLSYGELLYLGESLADTARRG
jgi:hypothetical protein